MVSADIKNHIIVCGYSILGQKIVKNLRSSNLAYVAIEHDRQHVKEGHAKGDIVFFGNAASKTMLNSLFVKNATAVIIAIDNDEKIRLICETINSIDPTITIVLKVSHKAQIDDFKDLKIDSFINENELVAERLVQSATQCNIYKG
jgi:CPA2 family monovalent cation:H+ antiporter-2